MFIHSQLDAGRRSALNALGAIQIFMGIALVIKEAIDIAVRDVKSTILTGESMGSSVYFDGVWYGVACCLVGAISVHCARMGVQAPSRCALRFGIFFNLVLAGTSAVLFALHVNFSSVMVGVLLGSSLGKTLYTFMLIFVYFSAAVYCSKLMNGLSTTTITTVSHPLPTYPVSVNPCHGHGHQGSLAAPPGYAHAIAPSSVSVHVPANSYISTSMLTH
ncbi:hypothetical protein RvY_17047-1 [Ramazzottius varieornatus]|uniref:Transmembrane protein n=1 Tax=Ramazzottius varieornatus TaxID=947166 RepID=A0A1D1W6W7_RAMVA|nr:hypothetical protein RvY_17047-1 [Ramazzottius varieornatus]